MDKISLDFLSLSWTQLPVGSPKKEEIRIELKKRIDANFKYSIEYFFNKLAIEGKTLIIYFIPSSESYYNFGLSITIVKSIHTDDDVKEFITKVKENKMTTTYGNVKVQSNNNLSEAQHTLLQGEGFNSKDVSNVEVYR